MELLLWRQEQGERAAVSCMQGEVSGMALGSWATGNGPANSHRSPGEDPALQTASAWADHTSPSASQDQTLQSQAQAETGCRKLLNLC